MAIANYDKGFRINGFEQIKAFYSWVFNNAEKRVSAQHISLYMFLLNQANRNNWVEWFKCPYDLAMAGACIGSKRTYYACLKELSDWELILYKKGINEWKAPLIKLEVLKCTSTGTSSVPLPEPLPTPQVILLPITLPTHIYKQLTDNIQLITDNIGVVLDYLKVKVERPKEVNIPFEIFWDKYDKKHGDKRACEKLWNSLTDPVRVKIIDTLPTYLKSITKKQFLPYPGKYLKEKRWDNDIADSKPEYELIPNPETGEMVKKLKRNDS
jgi:hypothetical protein